MRKQFLLLLTAILCALNVWAEKPSWVRDGDDWFDGTLLIFSNLGASAYANRTEIVHVTFVTGVSTIGESAFAGCTNITSVMMLAEVSSIGDNAFSGCTGLTSIEIPNSVTSIGDYAFSNCSGLTSFDVAFDNPNYSSIDGVLFNKDKTVILQYPLQKVGTSYNIPNSVTNIGNGAFSNCTGLTSIEIPNSVTSIGYDAFSGCTGLSSVTIPNSVTSIGSSAFEYCSNITEVIWNAKNSNGFNFGSQVESFTFGNEVEVIPASICLHMSKLRSIIIPNSVTSIGNNAFEGCSGLTSMTIPNSVTSIGYSAFRGCSGLTSVTIPNSVKSIGDGAFSFCSSLTWVTIPSSVTSIGEGAFSFCSSLTTVTIPSSVTSIGNRTFYNCSGLTSVEIPNSVTSIGDAAFYECTGLTSIEIPNSVTSIGNEAFAGCSNITDVKCCPTAAGLTWGDASNDFKANKATLCHVSPSQLSAYQTKFPDANLTFVGDLYDPDPSVWVLDGDVWDADTKTLTVNSNPGDQAYFSNPLIQHVIISGTVTDIGMRAFLHCSALTTVTIPNSVKSIGTIAFASCSNLATVTIGNSVTNIGDWAFADCSSLASLTCAAATPPTLGNNVFLNVPTSTCTLYVPKGSEEVYNARDQWAEFTNIVGVDVPSEDPFVDGIWYNFDDEHLTAEVTYQENEYDRYSGDVVIPASVTYNAQTYTVTSIGEGAFYDCSGLTSVEIPNSVTSIGYDAFSGCTGLTSVTIPNSVTSIGSWAFAGCSNITEVTWNAKNSNGFNFGSQVESFTFGNEVEVIPASICLHMSKLSSIIIPNSVTSIGNYAFLGCTGLTSVTIPNSVTSIGDGAFEDCSGLTSVTIPNSVTSIGNFAFYNCTVLTSVTIGNSLTSIGEWAFSWCTGLTSVTIPNSVTSIGDNAFADCSGLTSITCEATTPPTLKGEVFNSVDKSIPLYVPAESIDLYKAAEGWKDFENIEALDETPSPCITASGTCGENVTWSLGCDNVLTISGTGTMSNYSSEELAPWVANSDAIKSVIIGEGVTSIGDNAFYDCSGLTSVEIPNSVTSIGYDAFSGCTGLSSVTIPNSVTSIGSWAFNGCTGLTSVTIPNSVTSIGDGAFYYCTGLTSVTIGNSLTSIGEWAFSWCTGLTSVTIPNSVTSIGVGAFEYCSGLTSVTIPNSVTSIGKNAFRDCRSLASITCEAITPPTLSQNTFDNVDKSIPLYVPNKSVSLYQAAKGWMEFTNIVGEDPEEPIETVEGNYAINYVDKDSQALYNHVVTLYVPVAPAITGFTFLRWETVAADIKLGITIQAVYKADVPASAPEVYTNPANPAQKLIRNGNVYILTDDKTYTITGQIVESRK